MGKTWVNRMLQNVVIQELLKKASSEAISSFLVSIADRISTIANRKPFVGLYIVVVKFIMKEISAYYGNEQKVDNIIKDAELLKQALKKRREDGDLSQKYIEKSLDKVLYEVKRCANEIKSNRFFSFLNVGRAQILSKDLDAHRDEIKQLRLHVQSEIVVNKLSRVCQGPMLPFPPEPILEGKHDVVEFVTKPGIRVLAVYGMGGIGKTTLLEALIDHKFQSKHFVFLEVGEKPIDLLKLQESILSQLEVKDETFLSAHQAKGRLRDCFQTLKREGKELCLCIDNVWKADVLTNIFPNDIYNCLPDSSCIMLSTRSKPVTIEFRGMFSRSDEEYKLYELAKLDIEKARELFKQKGESNDRYKFHDSHMKDIEEILKILDGNPLAITVIGAHFARPDRREEEEWKMVKERLQEARDSPSNADGNDRLFSCLEVSIKFQKEEVQDTFIDAALFWRKQPYDMAKNALISKNGEDYLQCLLEDSIMYIENRHLEDSIENRQKLECHDLFFAIAIKLAKEKEYIYYPYNSSKLEITSCSQARGVFCAQKYDVPEMLLEHMSYLRFFLCPTITPPNWLMKNCPKLKALQLDHLERDTQINKQFPDLRLLNLKELNHDIGISPKLTYLKVWIGKVPLEYHQILELRYLSLSRVPLPNMFSLPPSLQDLFIFHCEDLKELPNLGSLRFLKTLALISCPNLMALPNNMGHMPSLKRLDIRECEKLEMLPDVLGPLPLLTHFSLEGCSKITKLPDSLGPLPLLEEFNLSIDMKMAHLAALSNFCPMNFKSLNLQALPETIGPLPLLRRLVLKGCARLTKLPDSLGPLPLLEELDLSSCQNLSALPNNIGPLSNLRSLKLEGCNKLKGLPETLGPLPLLRDLSLPDYLTSLPSCLHHLPSLTSYEGPSHLRPTKMALMLGHQRAIQKRQTGSGRNLPRKNLGEAHLWNNFLGNFRPPSHNNGKNFNPRTIIGFGHSFYKTSLGVL